MRTDDDIAAGYDFVICGAGPAGSVVAARLAEHPAVNVLLLEAGGWDDGEAVHDPERWQANLGTDRDWLFDVSPEPGLNGRSVPYNMGKVVGGGSAINACQWLHGHDWNWDRLAAESGEARWGAGPVRELYRTIEARHGQSPDSSARVAITTPSRPRDSGPPNPADAFLNAARASGLPVFDDLNNDLMAAPMGAARMEVNILDGRRETIFDRYVRQNSGSNLTVLARALATRIVFDRGRAIRVEFLHDGAVRSVEVATEVVISAGAIQSPKLLMQSGVGDEDALRHHGIPVVASVPEIGRNLQNHVLVPLRWKGRYDPAVLSAIPAALGFAVPEQGRPTGCVSFSTSCVDDQPMVNLTPILTQPDARGTVRLTGAGPQAPVQIVPNALQPPQDMARLVELVELARQLGASNDIRRIAEPGTATDGMSGADLADYLRQHAVPASHQCGTCRLGQDAAAVVDASLRLSGTENVRVADASVFPQITTGNTMAPCVIVGERAAQVIKAAHL